VRWEHVADENSAMAEAYGSFAQVSKVVLPQ
jgi:hypothetical protein